MNSLNVLRAALAVALTAVVVNVVCALAVALWPSGSLEFANAWMHGVDLAPIKATRPFGLGNFLYGVIGVALVGFVVGAVFACTYNLLRRLDAK